MSEKPYTVDEVAAHLYHAWAQFRLLRENVAGPKWFALRDDLKEQWREVARRVIR